MRWHGVIATPLLLVLLIGVSALVGVYVWRDARRRGLNAELWTLVALLAPALVGFIIYMLVRGNRGDLRCPKCASPVEERFVVCPKCGARLKAACPVCSAPTEPGWRVCPYCAKELEPDPGVTPPVQRMDKTLGGILLVVIIVPLVIIGAALLLVTSNALSGSVSATFYESREDYLNNMAGSGYVEELERWLDECERDPDKVCAYALRFRAREDESGEKVTQYLIYLPFGDKNTAIDTDSSFGLSSSVRVDFTTDGSGRYRGYRLCTVSVRGNTYVRLRTRLDLEYLPCEITEIERVIVPFDFTAGPGLAVPYGKQG